MAGALAILGGDGGGSYEKRIVLCLDLYPVEVVQHLHNFLQRIFRLPLVVQTETGSIFISIYYVNVVIVRQVFEYLTSRHVVIQLGLGRGRRVGLCRLLMRI